MTDAEIIDYLALSLKVAPYCDVQIGTVFFTSKKPGDKRSLRELLTDAIAADRANPHVQAKIADAVAKEITKEIIKDSSEILARSN